MNYYLERLGLRKNYLEKEKKEQALWVVLLTIFSVGIVAVIAYACYMLALDEYRKDKNDRTYKAGLPALWVYMFLGLVFISLQIYILVGVVECDEKFISCFPLYYILAFLGAIFVAWLLFSKELKWNHIVGIIFVIVGIIIYLVFQ